MKTSAAVLAAAALAAAGCGSETSMTGSTTASVSTTAQPPAMVLTVFRVRKGILRPLVVHVPRTRTVAAAALSALGIPARVAIVDGTAQVDLEKATDVQAAEIVYTLTQFTTVRRVDVAGRHGLTREDFVSYVPPILVERPAPAATVGTTIRVTGTASVFEATLVVQALRAGKVVERRTVTASEGAPGRGVFETTLHATPGLLTVQAFAPSAADGRPQHEVDVDVQVVG